MAGRAATLALALASALLPSFSPAPARAAAPPPAADKAKAPPPAADKAKAPPPRALLLLSKELKPYREAADALRARLGGRAVLAEVALGGSVEAGKRALASPLGASLVLAVGPEAALACAAARTAAPVVYGLVLDPERHGLGGARWYGVSLNIPAAARLAALRRHLPGAARLGLFHHAERGRFRVEELGRAAAAAGLRVVGLPLAKPADLPRAYAASRRSIDALWLEPDPAVVQREAIAFLLGRALEDALPVVGYNEWFARNGAVLSFAIDYRAVGRRMADLAGEILAGRAPAEHLVAPSFEVLLNPKLAAKLGIPLKWSKGDPGVRIIE